MVDQSNGIQPDTVDENFGGRWIAWDEANVHVIASGATADEAKQRAEAAGVAGPTLEFVPPSDAAFAGGV
jgi:hypothetical protein